MDYIEASGHVGKLVEVSYWDHADFTDLRNEKIGTPIVAVIWGFLQSIHDQPVPFLRIVNERDSDEQLSGSLILVADVISIKDVGK